MTNQENWIKELERRNEELSKEVVSLATDILRLIDKLECLHEKESVKGDVLK